MDTFYSAGIRPCSTNILCLIHKQSATAHRGVVFPVCMFIQELECINPGSVPPRYPIIQTISLRTAWDNCENLNSSEFKRWRMFQTCKGPYIIIIY